MIIILDYHSRCDNYILARVNFQIFYILLHSRFYESEFRIFPRLLQMSARIYFNILHVLILHKYTSSANDLKIVFTASVDEILLKLISTL